MSIARIIWIVSLLAAVIFAFVSGFAYEGAILAVLGIISGWFVDKEHRLGLLIAAIFMTGAGATAWGGIPAPIGGHLTAVLGSIGAVLAAAGVTAVLRRLLERVVLGKETG
ncbi:MAG: hypothetical protein JKY25_10445 [Robiginitomaculum sp.]|nr:hypothetical protein [Robiginitomaculum sp.]